MKKKIIMPRKKVQLVMDSFITIWEKNLPSEADIDFGKSFRIGEVPDRERMKSIFYSILGFNSQAELIKFTNNQESKIWVNKTLGEPEFFPNEELFLTEVKKALSPIIFSSIIEETANEKAILKRAVIIKEFFYEAMQFINVFEYDQQDWEVFPLELESVKQVIKDPENRVVISMSESDRGLLDIFDVRSMELNLEILNIQNMFIKYQDLKYQTDLTGKIYRVRLTKATDMNLLNTFILKSTLMNAKWVIEVGSKISAHKNHSEKLKKLSNVSDIVIKVQ